MGRPKSKVARRDFLVNAFLYEYQNYADLCFDSTVGRLFHQKKLPKKLINKFNQLEHLMLEKPHLEVHTFLDDEVKLFLKCVHLPKRNDTIKWFFLVGLYYGIQEMVKKEVLPMVLENDLFDAFQGKSQIEHYDSLKKLYDVPLTLPSDLRRKVLRTAIAKSVVVNFTRRVKDIDGIPWIELVASKLNISLERVRELASETRRQKVPQIEVRKHANGKEFLYIK